jgi:hypothetical protein
MRVVLLKLHLMFTDDLRILVKDDKPRTRRPTIHAPDKLSLLLFPVHQVVHPAHPEPLSPQASEPSLRGPDERTSTGRSRRTGLGRHQRQSRRSSSREQRRRSGNVDGAFLPIGRITPSDDSGSGSRLVRVGKRTSPTGRSAGERTVQWAVFVDSGKGPEPKGVAVHVPTSGRGSPGATTRPRTWSLHAVLPQRRRGM